MSLFRFSHLKTGDPEEKEEKEEKKEKPSLSLKKHNLAACVVHGLFFITVVVFFIIYCTSDIEFFNKIFADVIPLYYSSEKWIPNEEMGSHELLKTLNKVLTLQSKKGCAFPELKQTGDNATTLMFVLTLVYTFAAFFHHVVCVYWFTEHYEKQLETGILWWRYVEYAFSGSSMYVIILISAGYGDVHTLLLGFVAFALLQISGLCTDALLYSPSGIKMEFKKMTSIIVIVVGFVCFGALMYLPIHTLVVNWTTSMPVSIYALFTLEVTLFTGFGLVQLQRVVGQIGDDYWWYNLNCIGTVVILLATCFTIVALEIDDSQSVQNKKGLCVGFLICSCFLFIFFGLYPILAYWYTALFKGVWKDQSTQVIVETEKRFIYLSLFSKTLLTIILKMFVFTVGNLRSNSDDWTFGDTPLKCFENGH